MKWWDQMPWSSFSECCIVNKAEIDVFLELSCFFQDPAEVGNLVSVSSAFLKTSLNIRKFMVHILLKPGLQNFEHYLTSMWDECNCAVVWAFFGIAFLWDWNENGPFPVPWPLLSFPNVLAYWVHPGGELGNPCQYSCLENFEHYFTSMWDECNCAVVWAFFGIAFLWDWNENWPFPVPWPLLSFPNLLAYWVSTFTESSSRIWNSSTGIPSPPLALFVVMLSKAHLTSHSRMSGSRSMITPSWLSGSWRSFLYSSSVYSFLNIFCFC